ncbi:MAG: ABC transporter permease, partial [Firmicutes bacterium]|nr:ABC transporter permease [Bacillota bacterium]
EKCLKDAGTEYTKIYYAGITYKVTDNMIAELIVGNIDKINDFYHLRDWKSGNTLAASDDGIFIQKRVAETENIDVGDLIEIAIGATKTAEVKVIGIFDHYIGRPMMMTPACYERLYGQSCQVNAFMVRLGGADAEAIDQKISTIRGYESTRKSDSERVMFEASTSVVNALVAMLIFMAGVMASVVLMNLTNMYVLQKKRELTIMRVNGFTVKEVIAYMSRETVITTALGIVLGLGAGSLIAYKIITSMEQAFFQFDRSISFTAWLAGAALTIIFTVIVNIIALKPVKNLKLTDVA